MRVFLAVVPQTSKKTIGQKPLRAPFEIKLGVPRTLFVLEGSPGPRPTNERFPIRLEIENYSQSAATLRAICECCE